MSLLGVRQSGSRPGARRDQASPAVRSFKAASTPPGWCGTPADPRGHRRIHLDHWRQVPVYDFRELAAGQVLAGPAMVESETTTVLLRPGDEATATPERWLDIRVD